MTDFARRIRLSVAVKFNVTLLDVVVVVPLSILRVPVDASLSGELYFFDLAPFSVSNAVVCTYPVPVCSRFDISIFISSGGVVFDGRDSCEVIGVFCLTSNLIPCNCISLIIRPCKGDGGR